MYSNKYVFLLLQSSLPETDALDPQLERQVETIRNLVESYMRIVSKNVRDIIPKTIVFMLISEMKRFIHSELLPKLYAVPEQGVLMEESPGAAARRQSAVATHQACKDALKIIGDVVVETISTPIPPPVDNNWILTPTDSLGSFPQNASMDASSRRNFSVDLSGKVDIGKVAGSSGSVPVGVSVKGPPVPVRGSVTVQVPAKSLSSDTRTLALTGNADGATLSIAFGDKDKFALQLPKPLSPRPKTASYQ